PDPITQNHLDARALAVDDAGRSRLLGGPFSERAGGPDASSERGRPVPRRQREELTVTTAEFHGDGGWESEDECDGRKRSDENTTVGGAGRGIRGVPARDGTDVVSRGIARRCGREFRASSKAVRRRLFGCRYSRAERAFSPA